jgi:hypothetical protein
MLTSCTNVRGRGEYDEESRGRYAKCVGVGWSAHARSDVTNYLPCCMEGQLQLTRRVAEALGE